MLRYGACGKPPRARRSPGRRRRVRYFRWLLTTLREKLVKIGAHGSELTPPTKPQPDGVLVKALTGA